MDGLGTGAGAGFAGAGGGGLGTAAGFGAVEADESLALVGSGALLFGAGGTTLPADCVVAGGGTDVTSVGAPPSPFDACVVPAGSRRTTNAPTPPSASAASPTSTAGSANDRLGMSAPLTDRASIVR